MLSYILSCISRMKSFGWKDKLDRMEIDARKEADRLEKEVYDMIGYQINLNSPRQVAQAFSRLGIDKGLS